MMKKIIRATLFSLFAFATISSQAEPIKLLRCHIPSAKSSANIQCIYSVYGQRLKKPKAFSKLYANTNMPYASCQHALCNLDPDKQTTAICMCPIFGLKNNIESWKKISVGPLFFELIHPKFKNDQLESVPSNFSLVNTKNPPEFKPVTCQFDQPVSWANCAGKRCKVSYEIKDGKSTPIAECRCRVENTTVFVSEGPRSEKECKTPENKVWSGMSERQAKNDIDVLMDIYKRFYPQSPPIKKVQK